MAFSILLLGTQITVGGAQKVLLSQAQWFHARGHSVTAAFFYDKDNLRVQWASDNPFPVIDLGAWHPQRSRSLNLLLLLRGLFRLWDLLRSKKIEVIETFTPDSNILGLLIARIAGVPVRIATHHGYIEGAYSWTNKLHGWMINKGFAQRLVAVSDRVRRIAIAEEGIHPEKVVVILNGIAPITSNTPRAKIRHRIHNALGMKADSLLVLTVGRVTVQKGHTFLLDAIPKVLERFPNTVFAIAGEGHLRDVLKDKAAQLGVAGSTHFLGARSDIPDLLFAADVFVLPSLWEGLPLALLEAMSAGLPVVATRVEGVESMIVDGENGLLIPSEDVEMLSSALIKMIDDAEARARYGDRNRTLIEERYTIERMCERYEDLFRQIFSQEKC
ncbi:MAG: glycosyltransferase family 4 protein [Chloroflexi bacterium]|nr:glycosyltransferase family 4 protein [Chloroflexota bacterium]